MGRRAAAPSSDAAARHHRGMVAHALRSAMAHDLRVSVSAGQLSCMGYVKRMTNDPRGVTNLPPGGSTLTAHIDTGVEVIDVPVGLIKEVKRAE